MYDEGIDTQDQKELADSILEDVQTRRALLLALSELGEREREVMALRYGSEMSWAEVAMALKMSEANLRKICERTRGKLLTRIRQILGVDSSGTEHCDGRTSRD
jgi:RNA polymerase sigma-70 factor (ECF subfamily)